MINATILTRVKSYYIDTIQLYRFEELSKNIQDKLLNYYRNVRNDDETFGYCELQEFVDCTQKMLDAFDIRLEYLNYDNLAFNVDGVEGDKFDMSFKSTIKFILKKGYIKKYEYEYKDRRKRLEEKLRKINGKYYVPCVATSRHNYVSDCPFSGYYTDDIFFKTLNDFIAKYNKTKDDDLNLYDFLEMFADNIQKEYNELENYFNSDECIVDYYLAGELFDINGNINEYKILRKW